MKLINITTAILMLAATALIAQDNVDKEKVSPEEQKLMDQKMELSVQRGKVSSQLKEVNTQLRKQKGDILRQDKEILQIQKQIKALQDKIDQVIEKKYPDVAELQAKNKDLTEQFAEICFQQKDIIIELKKLTVDK